MIAIVDYGVANRGSMLNMLHRVGAKPVLASTPEAIMKADKIILPGVGAFDHGMQALEDRGLVQALRERVLNDGVPLLGVCLGMQMLGRGSEEGNRAGLGMIDAYCRRFRFAEGEKLKVPHMGWSRLAVNGNDAWLLHELDERARFYFVHSYHLVCEDDADVVARANYGRDFVALVQRGNVMGAQFHPEKSHRFGMALLRNFVEMRCCTPA
ncbi:imidazole glycerol phosphate synthase subunit HisH [Noviherbaspirillum galbum]|uniref:Imidazole glycerol phosphate synthase subunit HisH n=1 Tax=Noviherbaspirillum galbum TaxID=2709383 RepID=A0A6B3SXV2_9BURK|nr:imidazole glycerol phosphate synthase subunit HisH [Noviherbaspirillum galbum]NEX64026.1 imidazole glycerol phosphate synthase subunit HisH [Noviherbaspirillum galbum]